MSRLFVLSLTLLALIPAGASAQTIIREISIEGTQRIDPATVRSYMDVSVGDPLERATLEKALKNLFATGLFADVALSQNGSTLVVDVAENPIINEIAFEGNDKLEDDQLLAEIDLRPRQVFTRTRVQADVSRLYQVYRRNGRFSVTIEPKVIKLDQNRVNLVFEITEGAITKVETIRFVGNKRYGDDRLRSEISTKESAWYRFMSADDRYDPDRLNYDQELLRRFYLSQGYADFRLISAIAELSKEFDRFFVTFTLEEGDRYKVGKVAVNSNLRNFDATVLRPEVNVTQGEWYDADLVQESVDNLTNALGDRQYAFVNVRPDVTRNRESKTVDITFNIDETPRVFVERMNINGNMRTLDKVVRREIELVEGDPFNRSKLAKSEQNIKNLDFFEKVDVTTSPGSAPDKMVVDVDVAEKSTGELSVGAGFSTNDGPLADFRIRERNFLGKGQDLLFATTVAGQRTEFDLSFTEPYFLDRDVSAGADLFYVTRDLQDESSFDQKRTGGALRLGYPLSERWRQTLRYRVESNEIENVSSNASRFIQEQEGKRDTFALSQRTTYDNRDSTIFPTEGLLYWLDTEVSGLGGDSKYVSGKTGLSYYYPLYDQVVLNALGEVGAIEGYGDENVAINERFFIGGNTLRGFENSGIGPRDSVTEDALGGKYFYRGTLESSFPIGLPNELGVLGHAFTDAGTLARIDDTGPEVLDESSVRVSVGLGVSWRSPFGPIRADLSKAVVKEDYDQTEIFRFNFGTRF
ncbi:MAG: outer membrane protein assembly factor BamA [Alphaproteobacteria bacterium]|nr:outer membrane protein assembly factor BamA [Alphaproteobacteria bacterium]